MDANTSRFVIIVGLEVRDDDLYSKYRASMTPIMQEYGGAFEYDFVVSRVLKSPGAKNINRVFSITFPDESARTQFFADDRYLKVRNEFFDPAVASVTSIGEIINSP